MHVSPGKALALLRVGFGLYFLSYATDKLMGGWLTSATPMTNFLFGNPSATPPTRGAVVNSTPFYADFLTSVVQPNVQVFSYLVVFGELLAGALLVLGLLTRLGAITAVILNVNFMLMKGLLSNGGSVDRLFVLAAIMFFLSAAGLVWGLDGRLTAALAGTPVTRWLAGLNDKGLAPVPVAARIG